MHIDIQLFSLDKTARHFLAGFVLLLMLATLTGILYLYHQTSFEKTGVVENYNGSSTSDEDFDIPDKYPKPISELLLNIHNHLFGFAFIFFCLGLVFYFSSILSGFWKYFLLVEPFLSVAITFGSLAAMRFIDPVFVYFAFIGGVLTYLSFFIISLVLLYELLIKPTRV